MFKYFLKRLAQMVVTLFIVSILVFVLANFIGDPVNMLVSPKAPPEVREQVREELGLNRPILEQYVSFVTNALKGDFGKSYIYKVDVDQEEALETAFNIRTIPTLMFCPLDGPREMMIGTMGKLELKQLIQEKLLK